MQTSDLVLIVCLQLFRFRDGHTPDLQGNAAPGTTICLRAAELRVIIAALNGWFEPFALHQAGHRTSAATSALGFGFAALGLLLVALLLYNAQRAGGVYWTVSDASEQGSAVAGYLATYLLPLLAVGASGLMRTRAPSEISSRLSRRTRCMCGGSASTCT